MSVTRTEIEKFAKEFIIASLMTDTRYNTPESIEQKTELKHDIGLDSLDIAELSNEIDIHFDINIPEDKLHIAEDGDMTFGQFIDIVEEQVKAK